VDLQTHSTLRNVLYACLALGSGGALWLLSPVEASLSTCASGAALMYIKKPPNSSREYLLAQDGSSSLGWCAGLRFSCVVAHCANNGYTLMPPWEGAGGR